MGSYSGVFRVITDNIYTVQTWKHGGVGRLTKPNILPDKYLIKKSLVKPLSSNSFSRFLATLFYLFRPEISLSFT